MQFCHRMEEVIGSIPIRSTNFFNNLACILEAPMNAISGSNKTVLAGLLGCCVSKGQFVLSRLWLKDQAAPAIWNAVLAA